VLKERNMPKKGKHVSSEEVMEEFFKEDLPKHDYDSFAGVFDAWLEKELAIRGYDLYITSDGEYHCRECASIVKEHKDCPNCKKIIDWTKIQFGIEVHIIRMLKDEEKAVNDKQRIQEYHIKVKRMPDNELMNLYESIYNDLGRESVSLMEASFSEVNRRRLKAGKFWGRWFNRQQYEKWNKLNVRIEEKATKFILEKIQSKSR